MLCVLLLFTFVEYQLQELQAETAEVRRELEDKAQQLSQALERASDAEHQVIVTRVC